MPTKLPTHSLAMPQSTRAGNLFFACTAFAMLAISALVMLLPGGGQPS